MADSNLVRELKSIQKFRKDFGGWRESNKLKGEIYWQVARNVDKGGF